MWAYISGKILLLLFSSAIIKYFSLNSNIFVIEKFAGWFVNEGIIENLNFDVGKFIIINQDLRNLFLINIFKILFNFLVLISTSFFLEFGTILINSIYIYYLIFIYI